MKAELFLHLINWVDTEMAILGMKGKTHYHHLTFNISLQGLMKIRYAPGGRLLLIDAVVLNLVL